MELHMTNKKKAIVFDNSGTLVERYRALKDLKTGLIIDDVSSLDIVDNGVKRALVVLQTDPAKCIINARPYQTIYEFITRNKIKIDVSYSTAEKRKNEIIDAIKEDKSQVKDIQDTIKAVMDKNYNVQICSGSGIIVAVDLHEIEFTISSGGKIFPEVPLVIKELQKQGINMFIASGDRKASLQTLAKYIGLPPENVFDTADAWKKMEIVKKLKQKYKVMMVGNSVNDIFALKEADIGVLTEQQKENNPERLYNATDVVINNINELLDVDF